MVSVFLYIGGSLDMTKEAIRRAVIEAAFDYAGHASDDRDRSLIERYPEEEVQELYALGLKYDYSKDMERYISTHELDLILQEQEKREQIQELSFKKISANGLEQLNQLPNLQKVYATLESEIKKQKWPKLTNPSIVHYHVNGWEGRYQSLSIPPNVEFLRLERRTARLVASGLYELTKLKRLETFAYPKTPARILLDHPTLGELSLNGVKEEQLVLHSQSPLTSYQLRGQRSNRS